MSSSQSEEIRIQFEPIELRDIVRYAGASGDFHTLHYDRDLAIGAGYKDIFAQGMFIAGILGGAVADQYGPERLREFGVRFVSPCWVGTAPVICIREVEGELDEVRLELEVLSDDGVLVQGWATLE
jgi:hydroxyacyl-ACP dehydratase HTD2-like protein with hotdog domain